MKNILKAVAAACLLPMLAWAQGGAYTLKGSVADYSAPAKAYLLSMTEAGRKTDSTLISNGNFTFSGKVTQPTTAYLIINPQGTGITVRNLEAVQLYLEAGTITVTAVDSIAKATIQGGPVNTDNGILNKALKPVTQKMELLNKEYYAASPEQRKSKAFSDEIEKRYGLLSDEQNQLRLAFIKANPKSMLSLITLKQYAGAEPEVDEIEGLFKGLDDGVKQSAMGKAYLATLNRYKKTAVGVIAPDFTQTDTLGKSVSLHDFKGKYLLIDFWASWCGPCRAENPNVVKAYQKYHAKGLDILGVSLDQPNGKEKWLKAIHDDHLSWAHVSDLKGWKNEVAQLYSIQAIPQNLLLDPNGKIIAKNIRGEKLEQKLAEIFGQL